MDTLTTRCETLCRYFIDTLRRNHLTVSSFCEEMKAKPHLLVVSDEGLASVEVDVAVEGVSIVEN